MQGNSRPVISDQPGPHPRLREYPRPTARGSAGHVELERRLADHILAVAAGRPLVLDSGCGTGQSSVALAAEFPDSLVVGIDRSRHRLRQWTLEDGQHLAGNCLLLCADLPRTWRGLRQAGARLQRHYLLYPNPWPKARHVHRRWHAHQVFPEMLALGGKLELRSNWKTYVEEFAAQVTRLTQTCATVESLTGYEPLTAFEAKYAASGHRLWRVSATLPVMDAGLSSPCESGPP